MRLISWELAAETLFGLAGRRRLHDSVVMARFRALAPRYEEIYSRLTTVPSRLEPAGTYDWSSWSAQVRKSFGRRVPFRFLKHPTITSTMVFRHRHGVRATRWRIANVERVFGSDTAARLLREDAIGKPTISSLRWMTSANRSHHASHLAAYREACKSDFWAGESVIEWGGGYGNMARLIRRMNPGVTYTIIDLPELLALQYIYLGSLEGEENVHVTTEDAPSVVARKVNLVATGTVPSRQLSAAAFISTWALTESAPAAQQMVADRNFFGASRVLLASAVDQNNVLAARTAELGLERHIIPAEASLKGVHEYWFR